MNSFSKFWQHSLEVSLQKGKHDILPMLFLLELYIRKEWLTGYKD